MAVKASARYALKLLVNGEWNTLCIAFPTAKEAYLKVLLLKAKFNASAAIIVDRTTGEIVAEL